MKDRRRRQRKSLPRSRPEFVFTWDELQELSLLLGLLSESLSIDVDRAEHDLPEPDWDALNPTRENLKRVEKMSTRVQQAAKQQSPHRELTLSDLVHLRAFVMIMESELQLLVKREPHLTYHRKRKREAHRLAKVLNRVTDARMDEMFPPRHASGGGE